MNFKKDLLVIDTEFSGFDLNKHELLQIAAVLLDRKTLKEKQFFNSFIKPKKWRFRNPQAMAVNKITLDQVKDAPELEQVIKDFDKAFKSSNVIMTSYVGYTDKRFLLEAYKRAGREWKFDYHYFDIWSAAYAYLAGRDQLTSKKDFAGFGIEHLVSTLGINTPPLHDALVDCRVEAEVLRRIIKSR